jgi:hypothetical protein
MMKKLFGILSLIALSFTLIPATLSGQNIEAVSEDIKTRLDGDEIKKLMVQVRLLPVAEQDRKMDLIWNDKSGGATPRSDFLFCAGSAYLENYRAQACLGRAFELGRGIVVDPYESYVWYSMALSHTIDDREMKQKIQDARDRIKQQLITVYPAPSDHELSELVGARKQLIQKYGEEVGQASN